MKGENLVGYVILFLIYAAINIAVSIILFYHKPSGTLRIDHSNPEKDVYRIDIYDLDGLSKKKEIVLKVDNNAHLSQD